MSALPVRLVLHCMLLAAISSAVVACGRRGNLERPPEASVISVDEDGREVEEEPKADKPFILDPLL